MSAFETGENFEEILIKGEKLVRRYLNFDVENEPFWYDKNKENCMPRKDIQEMLNDLMEMEHLPFDVEDSIREKHDKIMKQIRDKFIKQMSHDEDVGLQCEREILSVSEDLTNDNLYSSQEKTKAHMETKNMYRALRYFKRQLEEIGAKEAPILTTQLIRKGHKVLMDQLNANAGELARNERITVCPIEDKEIRYPSPRFVEEVMPGFLDQANYIAVYLNYRRHREMYGPDFLLTVIKFCAWFFYNFISLHPFGDGNGRMARLLYCYLQSIISPFPVGIYNIFAPTRKRDYMEAIARTREKLTTQLAGQGRKEGWGLNSKPSDIATMIVETLWNTYIQYKLQMNDGADDSYESAVSDSQPTPSL